MDETTRNRLLKRYKTQVASGTSTVCATLAVVRPRQNSESVEHLLIAQTPLENVKTRMQTYVSGDVVFFPRASLT